MRRRRFLTGLGSAMTFAPALTMAQKRARYPSNG